MCMPCHVHVCMVCRFCGRVPGQYTAPTYCAASGTNADATTYSSNDAVEPCIYWSTANVPLGNTPNHLFLTSQVSIIPWQESNHDGVEGSANCNINSWTDVRCRFGHAKAHSYLIPDLYAHRHTRARVRMTDAPIGTRTRLAVVVAVQHRVFVFVCLY